MGGSQSTWREHMHAHEHANSTQKDFIQDSNQEPSCCEATVLSTTPPCSPQYVFKSHKLLWPQQQPAWLQSKYFHLIWLEFVSNWLCWSLLLLTFFFPHQLTIYSSFGSHGKFSNPNPIWLSALVVHLPLPCPHTLSSQFLHRPSTTSSEPQMHKFTTQDGTSSWPSEKYFPM